MKAFAQLVTAIFVVLAVLAVFIYPLTFGPPAPSQKIPVLAKLLSALLAVVCLLYGAATCRSSFVEGLFSVQARESCARLALNCTRLC